MMKQALNKNNVISLRLQFAYWVFTILKSLNTRPDTLCSGLFLKELSLSVTIEAGGVVYEEKEQ